MGGALISQTAHAQSATAHGGKPAANAVSVTNSRGVALIELDAARPGGYLSKAMVKNLAPGKRAATKIPTDEDCVYDLRGRYADGSVTELPGVDLCKDPKVNLVD
jgi:hypothetical protein